MGNRLQLFLRTFLQVNRVATPREKKETGGKVSHERTLPGEARGTGPSRDYRGRKRFGVNT